MKKEIFLDQNHKKIIVGREKVRRSGIQKAVMIAVLVLFSVYAFTLVFPFLWMLFNSVKASDEFFKSIWSIPKELRFSNYWFVLTKAKYQKFGIVEMFGISIFTTVAGTFLSVMVSALGAYTVAKYKFKGNGVIFALAIFVMVVPIAGTLPAQYRLMQTLHLTNSFVGLFILYSSGLGFNFFILYGFFKSLSWSYAEAAFIDGAGNAGVFFKIMLPLAKPALISLAVIHSIGLWNDYTTPSIYLRNIPTLAVGLNYLIKQMTNKSLYPEMFATMIVGMLPILIIFIAFQKTIMENTIAGGLKG